VQQTTAALAVSDAVLELPALDDYGRWDYLPRLDGTRVSFPLVNISSVLDAIPHRSMG
jgi:hypothetical protein